MLEEPHEKAKYRMYADTDMLRNCASVRVQE